jgi:hypothetical protein
MRIINFLDGFESATEPTIEDISYDNGDSGLAATNLQDAIDELDSNIDAHLADTTDAHDASAISNVAAGGIASTTVQAALNELDSDKVAKISSTDNTLPRFHLTGGDLQSSGVAIDDSNNVTGVNDLTVGGNLIVQGTTTTFDVATMEVEDPNILVNKGGNQATANSTGAGVTVDVSDGTDAALSYDSTKASKFKIGEVGSQSEIVTATHTQTMTDKTLTSPVLNGSLTGTAIKDEDDMVSDSATAVPTQQSVKAYVDAEIASVSGASFQAPTVQIFTSGSGTYTRPTGPTPLYLKVIMCGGGGGGGCSGTTSGTAATNGGNTTFGTSLLTANGGSLGARYSADGGAGGTTTVNSPAIKIKGFDGGTGQGANAQGSSVSGATPRLMGSVGGANPLGGAGVPASTGNGGASAVAANTGAGGGGASASSNTNSAHGGSGGGAGGYIEAIIPSPSGTYSYAVGSAGTGQAAGSNGHAGGNGAAGIIIVEEHYQ